MLFLSVIIVIIIANIIHCNLQTHCFQLFEATNPDVAAIK